MASVFESKLGSDAVRTRYRPTLTREQAVAALRGAPAREFVVRLAADRPGAHRCDAP